METKELTFTLNKKQWAALLNAINVRFEELDDMFKSGDYDKEKIVDEHRSLDKVYNDIPSTIDVWCGDEFERGETV